jgi:hypothetical protein
VRALTAAAKALYLTEHPGTPGTSWDALSERTQIFWAMKAGPTAMAVANVWENH